MRIVEETCGDVRILRLSGEFDAADVPAVTARLGNAPGRVFVNLRDVTFASAAALGSLLEARIRRKAGDLVLVAPSRPVRRLARAVGLDRLFPTREEEARPIAGTGPFRAPCVA